MAQLVPCPSCARHVKTTESSCPFCSAPLSSAADRASPRERLGRAATFAFGAAVATSVAACSGPTPPPDAGHDAAVTADAGTVDAATEDDAAVTPDAGSDAGTDAAVAPDSDLPDAGIAPPYGAPPEDSGVFPPYGAPPEP